MPPFNLQHHRMGGDVPIIKIYHAFGVYVIKAQALNGINTQCCMLSSRQITYASDDAITFSVNADYIPSLLCRLG